MIKSKFNLANNLGVTMHQTMQLITQHASYTFCMSIGIHLFIRKIAATTFLAASFTVTMANSHYHTLALFISFALFL